MLGNGGQSGGDLGGNGDPGEENTPEGNGPAAPEPGTCTLYPEQTEGPYYVDGDLVRSDIREGKPGTPLTLDLLVVSAGVCAPLANVAVDIWHCDAERVYSGYQGQRGGLDTRGEVFLRGTQVSGSDGRVRFQTISTSRCIYAATVKPLHSFTSRRRSIPRCTRATLTRLMARRIRRTLPTGSPVARRSHP